MTGNRLLVISFVLCTAILLYVDQGQAQYWSIRDTLRPAEPQYIRQWKVLLGRRVLLNCSVELPPEANPQQVQYRWEHPEGVVVGYQKVYDIPRVTWSDAGEYVCHSSVRLGPYGEEWSDRQKLNLRVDDISIGGANLLEPPTIVLTPGDPGPVALELGNNLYSRCSVPGEENEYDFKWVRHLPGDTMQQLSSNAILLIPSVKHEDIMNPIFCQVTRRSDGEVFEKQLNVRMLNGLHQLPSNLRLSIRSLPPENLAEGKVMRQCLFENGDAVNQQFDFRWLDHTGRVITNGDALYLVLENPIDLGDYTCEAIHRQTGSKFHAKYHVARHEEIQAARYEVNIRALTPDANVGRPYSMMCEVTPQPAEQVQYLWYHNDQLIGRDQQLDLRSLSYPDIGTYVCNAQWTPAYSRSGSTGANATLELALSLTKERQMTLSAPPGSVLVTLPGENRELHCEFDIPNPQDIRWYFEGQPLESHPTLNATNRVFRVDRMRVSIISLRGVQSRHAGTYECRVDGVNKQTHVIVRMESGLEINPEVDTVNEGASVEFHCRAHGVERSINRQLEWYFRPFNEAPRPLELNAPGGFQRHDDPYASHTSFISKQRVTKADEGEYICRLPMKGEEVIGKLYVRSGGRLQVTITPSNIKVRARQPIEMECYATEDTGRPSSYLPVFRVRDSRIRYQVDRIANNRVRLSIPDGLTVDMSGTQVECYIQETGTSTTGIINVEDACPQGHRHCRTGECLPAGRFCDGVPDCADRSDEDPLFCSACDPIAKKCEYYRNAQPLKQIYMIHWACDGEDDCGNGFDESRCPDPSITNCGPSTFTCPSDNRQIPMAFVCDKDQDCQYGEDERNCVPPSIEQSPNYRYPTRVGSQVTLQCRVIGSPAPRVIWRFNWGCLADEGGRFRVMSRVENCDSPTPTVISTLTITDVRPGDDGIYNCEALSGSHRAMSNDYFVTLQG